MRGRAALHLRDTGPNDPENWEPKLRDGAHILFTIYGHERAVCEAEVDELSGRPLGTYIPNPVLIGIAGVPSLIDSRDIILGDLTVVGILGASAGLAPAISKQMYASFCASALPMM